MGIKTSLVIITDGRYDYLKKTIESLNDNVKYPFHSKLIVNDQGDGDWNLKEDHPSFQIISHNGRQGLAQAVRTAWTNVPDDAEYVFHLEDDFVFNEAIDLEEMALILEQNSFITQMLLKRQPWGDQEPEYGGYVEMDPDAFTEISWKDYGQNHLFDATYCTHRKWFSLNPCLIPKRITDMNWDDDNEKGFSTRVFENPRNVAGLLGAKFDAPKVHHIGDVRTHSGGYGQ